MASKLTDEQYIKAAREAYQVDGQIEVDDDAKISRNEDEGEGACQGAYVQAWVWVDDPE